MKKSYTKIIILSLIFLFSGTVFAKKSFTIDVDLFPAGSFQIESKRIKGKIFINEHGDLDGKNIRIAVKSLNTGIDLRDHHLKKKLGIEQNKKGNLILTKITGKGGVATAHFKVLNIEQKAQVIYKLISDKLAEATFSLSLKKFGIIGISYMGIGVEDTIMVKIQMPYFKK